MRFPVGHLPLFLALMRGWSPAVIKLLLDAYPDGATVLDPLQESKKPSTKVNLKKMRWARQIVEEHGASPEVLKLLPSPKKKKKDVVWHFDDEAAADSGSKKKKK